MNIYKMTPKHSLCPPELYNQINVICSRNDRSLYLLQVTILMTSKVPKSSGIQDQKHAKLASLIIVNIVDERTSSSHLRTDDDLV